MNRLVVCVLLAVLPSCAGSAELRGGTTLVASEAPSGVGAGVWVPKDCRDAKGGSAERATRVLLIKRLDGRRELVEQRQGYDSLVVRNSFVDGSEVVYQVILKPAGGDIALHEFRLPNAGGKGRLRVARHWKQVDSSEHRFRGYVGATVLTCSLEPQTRPPASPAEGGRPQTRASSEPARQSASAGQDPRP